MRTTGTDCAPTGTTSCGDGFQVDPAGWGCIAVHPAAGCDVGTRGGLGSTDCIPLDDCSAPFPPQGTDVVVDSSATPSSTSVRTIGEAIARVPAGGLIAVSAGHYSESVSIGKSMRIIGRCARDAVLDVGVDDGIYVKAGDVSIASMGFERRAGVVAPSNDSVTGIIVAGGRVTLTNIDLENLDTGVVVGGAASDVTISASVADGHDQTRPGSVSGFIVLDGGSLHVTDVDIRRSENAISAYDDTHVDVSHSLIEYDGARTDASLVSVLSSGSVAVDGSFVATRAQPLFFASNEGGTKVAAGDLAVANSVLEQSGVATSDEIVTLNASRGNFDNLTVRYQSAGVFWFHQAGATGSLKNSVIRLSDPGADSIHHMGLRVSDGSHVSAEGVAILSPVQVGVFVDGKNADLTMVRSLVTGTTFGLDNGEGTVWGFGGAAIEVVDRANLTLSDSALIDNVQFGISAGGGTVLAKGDLIDGTPARPDGAWGEGVFADAASVVDVDSCTIAHARHAGVCFGGESYGSVVDSKISSSRVGIYSELYDVTEASAAPSSNQPKTVTVVATEIDVDANTSDKYGSGPIPWPLTPGESAGP